MGGAISRRGWGTLLFPLNFAQMNIEWKVFKFSRPGTSPSEESGWQAQEGGTRSSLSKLLLLYLPPDPA